MYLKRKILDESPSLAKFQDGEITKLTQTEFWMEFEMELYSWRRDSNETSVALDGAIG